MVDGADASVPADDVARTTLSAARAKSTLLGRVVVINDDAGGSDDTEGFVNHD